MGIYISSLANYFFHIVRKTILEVPLLLMILYRVLPLHAKFWGVIAMFQGRQFQVLGCHCHVSRETILSDVVSLKCLMGGNFEFC